MPISNYILQIVLSVHCKYFSMNASVVHVLIFKKKSNFERFSSQDKINCELIKKFYFNVPKKSWYFKKEANLKF